MRYAIFADIHSNLEALEAVLAAYKKESIGQYLCVGDVVGYAANPNECIEKIRSLCKITVAGNHDWASVNFMSIDYFNPEAKEAILWTKGNLGEASKNFLESLKLVYKNEDLTLVHATLDNPQDFSYMTDGYIAWETIGLLENNICFIGHTHNPGTFIRRDDEQVYYQKSININIEEGNKYIINVGSVGQPRDNSPLATYCIYDTDKKEIQIKRIEYNIEITRKKIIEAGLPSFLGDRLLTGV